MGEISENINKKTIITLSRNQPVALVVGAAGFLGSHLADKLLDKGMQVAGLDNLSTGKKKNLEEAVKNKNFHFLLLNAQDLDLEINRLDYVFTVAGEGWDLANLLKLIKEKQAKSLFVSSIDLYEGKGSAWFKKAEETLAKFAQAEKLNIRILRLGAVFGPRMHFREKEPLLKLIQTALNGQLQKDISLEFSSRALYVSDASELMVKAVLSGATALKIFDGVHPHPVKIAEVKQILLDPIWYEVRKFTPQELPPWPTPNLVKTTQVLNWSPRANIVWALRQTLKFFKDTETEVPKLETDQLLEQTAEIEESNQRWREEKKEELKTLKETEAVKEAKKGRRVGLKGARVVSLALALFIFFALIFPAFETGWGILTFNHQLSRAFISLEKGEFEEGRESLAAAKAGIGGAKKIYDSLEPLRGLQILSGFFELGDNLYYLASLTGDAARSASLGMDSLYQGVLATTGEKNESPKEYFLSSKAQLSKANEDLVKAKVLLEDKNFISSVPQIILPRIESLEQKLSLYLNLIEKGTAASLILPEVVALDGAKNYLILLQNNMELRPAGGFIGSYGLVAFEGGKLKKIEVNDIYAIDGQLKIHVEPPKEIREDLGQKDWYLRDSNWESDFPTSAKQAEWFFNQETGQLVSGVIALDISAMEKMLEAVGSLDLVDYNEKISSENLFPKAITYAETSFFAGSQSKKNFLTALTTGLFNKIFFSKNPNWPGIVAALGYALEGKHLSIFLDDPKLFSYLVAQNWANALPRPKESADSFEDFIAPVEANLGANKSNYYLERSYNLDTTVGKEGEVKHRLRIGYVNNSPSGTWPAGKYKNRFRIYLPFGAKLTRALFGEKDITKEASAFVDYGRSAFSLLIEVNPKEQKNLVLDIEVPSKLNFKEGVAKYRLDMVKQAGTLQDPFKWTLTYPLNYQIETNQDSKLAPQEQIIETDLSKDRSFEVVFRK